MFIVTYHCQEHVGIDLLHCVISGGLYAYSCLLTGVGWHQLQNCCSS
jgi:hypothetical protein